jgi:ABC-type Fe3+ transport system substrate-binding protein
MKRKMITIGLLVCFGFLLWLPASILAQEKPAAAEAKKVVDYYYQGKGQGAI